MLRFYDLESGEIFLNGSSEHPEQRVEIKQIPLKNLREIFGLVGQEPFLFNLSVLENVRYNTHSSKDEIKDACIQANAMEFIEGDEARLVEPTKDEAVGFERKV